MPGVTNFLQWNPSQVNQDTDVQYQGDTQRIGGAPVGTPFPSRTGNKVLYQCTTGVAALMQMMANKGFTVTDTNIGNLTAVLSAIQTTADLKAPLLVVPFSPSAAFNVALSTGFQMTLNGNANSCGISGWSPGSIITFVLIQDATGGRTFNIPGVNGWPIAINPTPNSVSVLQIVARGDNTLWPCNQELLFIPYVQQGGGIGQSIPVNKVYIGWSGSRLKATVDVSDLGNIVFDTQLNAAIATVNGSISTINGEITTLNGQVSSINSSITAINAALAASTGVLASNGWVAIRLSSGARIIFQWGSTGDFDPTTSVSFPIPFPSICAMAMGTDRFGGNSRIVSTVGVSNSSATFQKDGTGNGIFWFAIGF